MNSVTRKGFTLIELLVVIAIIAILAAILFPVFVGAKESGRKASCQSNAKQMAIAMFAYMVEYDDVFPRGAVWVGPESNDYKFWADLIDRYVKNKKIRECPSLGKVDLKGYPWAQLGVGMGMNVAIGNFALDPEGNPAATRQSKIRRGSRTVLFADGEYRDPTTKWRTGHWGVTGHPAEGSDIRQYSELNPNGWPDTYIGFRHTDERANVVFVDGHAATLNLPQLTPKVLKNPVAPDDSLWDFN